MTKNLSNDPDQANQDTQSLESKNRQAVGVSVLIDMVRTAMEESNPEAIVNGFDPAEWLHTWLEKPLPALGGIPPGTLISSTQGQALVTKTLAQALEGAFA